MVLQTDKRLIFRHEFCKYYMVHTWYTVVVYIHHSCNVLLKLKPKEHCKEVASSPLSSL